MDLTNKLIATMNAMFGNIDRLNKIALKEELEKIHGIKVPDTYQTDMIKKVLREARNKDHVIPVQALPTKKADIVAALATLGIDVPPDPVLSNAQLKIMLVEARSNLKTLPTQHPATLIQFGKYKGKEFTYAMAWTMDKEYCLWAYMTAKDNPNTCSMQLKQLAKFVDQQQTGRPETFSPVIQRSPTPPPQQTPVEHWIGDKPTDRQVETEVENAKLKVEIALLKAQVEKAPDA